MVSLLEFRLRIYFLTPIVREFIHPRGPLCMLHYVCNIIYVHNLCYIIHVVHTFSDLELMEKCESNCEAELIDCIVNCGTDSVCVSQCNRDQASCINCKHLFIKQQSKFKYKPVHARTDPVTTVATDAPTQYVTEMALSWFWPNLVSTVGRIR